VPRGGELGRVLAEAIEAAGFEAVVAPFLAFEPPTRPASLDGALRRLGLGRYAWVVLTSANALAAIPEGQRFGGARLAVIGRGTAKAALDRGISPVFIHDEESGRGLVAGWPASADPGRVLVLQSDLAGGGVARGLRGRGHPVDRVVAYRTVAVEPPSHISRDLALGRFDAVVVTSGSAAAAILATVPDIPTATRIVCIGPRTAREARQAGLRVAAVAEERSAAGLVAALEELFA
jgi:uroporphyrinogen-III synthase